MIHIQNPVYYRKFRHIQAYLPPVQRYSGKLWHIYNPLQLLHIENPAIFRTWAYLGPSHIQNPVYIGTDLSNNDSYNNINFFSL